MHFKSRVDDVKRGILMAGGFPMELPALSLSEIVPEAHHMLYRNLLAMDAEELLRGHPVDGVVLMGGCDKTTPALLLGATSMNLPAIFLPAGPMLRGNWQGKTLGSGSDSWKYWDELRAGKITDKDWLGVEAGIARSLWHLHDHGHGQHHDGDRRGAGHELFRRFLHPGGGCQPYPHGFCLRPAHCRDGLGKSGPSRIQGRKAFENAIAVAMAMGCSTNAIIHLIAMARRAGVPIGLDDFERYSRIVPVIGNIRPSGTTYLMEDFYYAGGLRGLMHNIREHLHLDALTCSGRTLGEELEGAAVYNDDVIRPVQNPVYAAGRAGGAEGQPGTRRLRHQTQRL